MERYDILALVAELSVALVGFSGVVVILRGRSAEVGLQYMLQSSVVLVLLALAPMVALQIGITENITWVGGSVVAGVCMVMINVLAHLRLERRYRDAWYWFYNVMFYGFAGLSAWNAVQAQCFGVYLAVLVWMLVYCMLLFVRLLLAHARTGQSTICQVQPAV